MKKNITMMFSKPVKKKKSTKKNTKRKKNPLKECRIDDPKLRAQFKKNPCVVCKAHPSDPCHIRSKGAGGDDVPDNLISLCRSHHRLQHDLGWTSFAERFPSVKWILENKGWQIVERFGQKKLEYGR